MKKFEVHFTKQASLIIQALDQDTLYQALDSLTDQEKNNLLRHSSWKIEEVIGSGYVQGYPAHSVLYKGNFLHPQDVPGTPEYRGAPRACDDCGLRTHDLITKGDHHGGEKTVCTDRNACHGRGG